MFRRMIMAVLFITLIASNVHAIKVEGTFNATKSCPAYKSFRHGHNPGDIQSMPGRTYEVVEENKAKGPWVLVMIPEISHSRRWVAKECGIVSITSRPGSPNNGGPPVNSNGCNVANTYDSNVLALSWQAGFCEHFNYSGSKPECDNLNDGNISVTNITIHGLWPNKSSCGRGYGNCSDESLNLEDATRGTISPWMPNFIYETKFGEHEWRKHGTCQALSDDEYFLLTQRLAAMFDGSALGQYLRDNIGQDVLVADMETQMKSELGEEVTRKIELRCTGSGKRYVNEFWINLPKELNETGSLDELVSGAGDKRRFRGNCATTIHIEAPGV